MQIKQIEKKEIPGTSIRIAFTVIITEVLFCFVWEKRKYIHISTYPKK